VEHLSLRTYLQQMDSKLSYNERLELINQCCQAVEFAHNHLNHTFDKLTLDNFVVTPNGDVRLLHFDEQWQLITNLDMYKYLPINEFSKSKYNNVWQFGVLVYEAVSCPFEFSYGQYDRLQVRELIGQGLRQPIPRGGCSQTLYKLILDCWQDDPLKRPTMSDCTNSIRKILTNSTTMHKNHSKRAKSQHTQASKPQPRTSLGGQNVSVTITNPGDPSKPQKISHRSYSSIGTLETSSNEGQSQGQHHLRKGGLGTHNVRNVSQSATHNHSRASGQIAHGTNTSRLAHSAPITAQSKQSSSGRLSGVVGNSNNTCELMRGTANGPGTIVEV